jgi:hypothetical protein
MSISISTKLLHLSYMVTYKKMLSKIINAGDKVLDVGSGIGFAKPLVTGRNALYKGVEPRKNVFEQAVEIYGAPGFSNSLLLENATFEAFDKVICFTVLDEVQDKEAFLKVIKSYSHSKTEYYISVRNSDFPLRRSKTVHSTIDGSPLQDLGIDEWVLIFEENEFLIEDLSKFQRPVYVGISFSGLKTFLLTILYFMFPLHKSYILLFKLKGCGRATSNPKIHKLEREISK